MNDQVDEFKTAHHNNDAPRPGPLDISDQLTAIFTAISILFLEDAVIGQKLLI